MTTKAQLEQLVSTLNAITGNSQEAYTKSEDGHMQKNAGHYYVGMAYGGYALEQMCEGGGSRTIFGRFTKSLLESHIHAFIDGIRLSSRQEK